jgi:two-component system sensor histidine kinase PilS (NtrC family)
MSATELAADSASTAPDAAPALRKQQREFPWRVLILLNVFRLTLTLVLLAVYHLVVTPRIVGESDPKLAWSALLAMLAFGCASLVTLHKRSPSAAVQTYLQFGADLVAIILLIHSSGGISSGLGGLLIVSVGALALLVPPDRAFMFSAVTTLALLLEQLLAQLEGLTTAAQFAPAGILGAVLFVITAVVQLLRHQVIETTALAEQRGVDLRDLVQLNEYIIQHLRESIVVVDGDDQIRLINESAVKHLGAGTRRDGSLWDASPELAKQLNAWRDQSSDNGTISSADRSTPIQPHFAPLGQDRRGGVVIFLEDTSLIRERVQQAKLAALGRLSASIAHEIRNPIGAMSHAGQLLAESPEIGQESQRLTDIIRVNARRVSQIVESVLALSRKSAAHPERLQLLPWLEDFAREFVQTVELYEDAIAVTDASWDVQAEMDPTHLHQIVWNLCDNAVKYASATAGAIAVELSCGYVETSGRPYLEVADRGPGIEPANVDEIFEPFFTSQPGGTGLGLYISRELAERNGATLRYYPRPGGGSLFRVVFADPGRWQAGEETS